MRRLPLPSLLVLLLVGAGCDRPFVAVDPPRVEVVEPADLGDVRTGETLDLALRVSAVRGVSLVVVGVEVVTPDERTGLYHTSVALASGLNAIPVRVEDVDDNVSLDTLYALRLALTTVNVPSAALPEGRAYHTTTALPDGRLLVAGGAGDDGIAQASTYLVTETAAQVFSVTSRADLARARAGHAAVLLPDGRVLLLGGSTRAEPIDAAGLVTPPEVLDPATGASTLVATRGAPLRRAGHTAVLLASGGRQFVYVWGGRTAAGSGLETASTYEVFEWKADGDSLVTLSPPGGVGLARPVTRPAAAPLPSLGGTPRAVSTGLYLIDGTAVASEHRFRTGTGQYPFEVVERTLLPPQEPRDAGAADALRNGLVVLAGGRTPGSTPREALDVFAAPAARFFHVPPVLATLRTARYGHTATSLSGNRILLLGGYTGTPTPTASAEAILTQ